MPGLTTTTDLCVPALLGGLLAALAGLVPAPVVADDRDLQATPVPPAACAEVSRSGFTGGFRTSTGPIFLAGPNTSLRLHCPLPVNNVEVSGAGNDNDLSKLRVHYRDSDGLSTGVSVTVDLVKAAVTAAGAVEGTTVCSWNSNQDGTGSTSYAKATKACAHDIAAEAFYYFDVRLQVGASGFTSFVGISFPQ